MAQNHVSFVWVFVFFCFVGQPTPLLVFNK
jgi:hypothetical protein